MPSSANLKIKKVMYPSHGRRPTVDMNYMDDDGGINYTEDKVTVDPGAAKEAIKSLLIKEIGEYVKGAFRLTCENIEGQIEAYKKQMEEYTVNKIEEHAQKIAEQLAGRILDDKLIELVIEKLTDKMLDAIITKKKQK